MVAAIMRLCELNEGVISIDGVDISSLNVRDLRASIAVIPQHPWLIEVNL
jgi:ABC-type multidrug transport system fused ATPase/permease subunit